jgi:hypothetical protein
VRGLPVVTVSRVDTTRLSSFGIDRAVREAVGDGRPVYAIESDLLEALEPDLILTQNLCTVCTVFSDAVDELCASDAEVVALDAHTLAEIEERILSLANLLGVPSRGRSVVDEMQVKIAVVAECVSEAPRRPVFVAEWLEPPYAAGHWIPEVVASPAAATCSDERAALLPDLVSLRCAGIAPNSSSSPPASSTTGAPPARRRFRRSLAARRRRLECLLRATGSAARRRCRTSRLPHPPGLIATDDLGEWLSRVQR